MWLMLYVLMLCSGYRIDFDTSFALLDIRTSLQS